MRSATRWSAAALAVLAALAVSAAFRQDDQKEKAPPIPAEALDKMIFDSLRDVINRGAEVYNDGDHAGCYRIFEGALRAVRPLLAHRPELQKLIGTKLTEAEGDSVVWRRAFTLRSALDKVRTEVNPNPKKDKDELKGKPNDPDKDKDKAKDKDKDQQPKKDKEKEDEDKKKADEAKKKKDEDDKKKKDEDDKKKKDEQDKKDKDDVEAKLLPAPDVEKVN